MLVAREGEAFSQGYFVSLFTHKEKNSNEDVSEDRQEGLLSR